MLATGKFLPAAPAQRAFGVAPWTTWGQPRRPRSRVGGPELKAGGSGARKLKSTFLLISLNQRQTHLQHSNNVQAWTRTSK